MLWTFRSLPEFHLELLVLIVELHARTLIADDEEHDRRVVSRTLFSVRRFSEFRQSLVRVDALRPVGNLPIVEDVLVRSHSLENSH